MTNKPSIETLVNETRILQNMFKAFEGKPWTVETFTMELLAETGSLADIIIIKEGYRVPRKNQQEVDIEDGISDVLFVLIMIADHYGIDIASSYMRMVEKTKKKLSEKSKGA